MFTRYLTTLLILALSVAATPVVVRDEPISLPVAKRVSSGGPVNLARRDRARAKELMDALDDAHGSQRPHSGTVPVNNTGVTYVAQVCFIILLSLV